MYELKKKFGKVFTSKSVGTGPSSYKKRIYRAADSQRLRNTAIDDVTEDNSVNTKTCAARQHEGEEQNVQALLRRLHFRELILFTNKHGRAPCSIK